MKFKLEIEIDQEAKVAKITDSRTPGEAKEFKGGIYIAASDGNEKKYYSLAFGSAADLGWAMAQFFNDGWKDKFIKRLFAHFTEWINKFFVHDGKGFEPNDLDEVLDKWEEEDKKKKPTTFN